MSQQFHLPSGAPSGPHCVANWALLCVFASISLFSPNSFSEFAPKICILWSSKCNSNWVVGGWGEEILMNCRKSHKMQNENSICRYNNRQSQEGLQGVGEEFQIPWERQGVLYNTIHGIRYRTSLHKVRQIQEISIFYFLKSFPSNRLPL